MVIGKNRETKLIVDLAAITHNIQHERQILAESAEMFAVVKANGYGHGILTVAKTALNAGATGLCVAILDEALALREAGITVPILVLGITSPAVAEIAAKAKISLTVGSVEWLREYEHQSNATEPLNVHLGMDTGMGRIGFRDVEEVKTAEQILKSDIFNFEGVFTHFATADQNDAQYFDHQFEVWHQLTDALTELPKYVHVANSATSLWHLPVTGNMIRLGIAMYGLNPSGLAIKDLPYELEPAAELVTKLDFVKQIKAGNSVSYGATYTAKNEEWIGTVPVGYADGYPRCMTGFYVLIDGQRCEIIGRICMDQMMIRLPKQYSIGSKVTLIGLQGDQQIGATEIAEYAGTINYEIMTSIAERVERIYK